MAADNLVNAYLDEASTAVIGFAPILRVELGRETGRSHEIAKHHRDRVAFGRDSGIVGRPRL
jgi:hypothetical protein